MKNTTKLKNILQLYTIQLDMDLDGNILFTMRDKRNGSAETFADKSYSVVIAKGFGHMKKALKFREAIGAREKGRKSARPE